MKNNFPKRGEVYWVRLDPTDGKEIKKTRPCLIISSDIANQSELIIVAPITSNIEKIFTKIEVKVSIEGRICKVLPRQMRCIDKTKRLGNKIGQISSDEMMQIENALKVILEL